MPGYNNINRHKTWHTKRADNMQTVLKAQQAYREELNKIGELKQKVREETWEESLHPTKGLDWMYKDPAVHATATTTLPQVVHEEPEEEDTGVRLTEKQKDKLKKLMKKEKKKQDKKKEKKEKKKRKRDLMDEALTDVFAKYSKLM
eukprot:TRINITY_DN65751_c0_g1_i1.p1 TRINITY_DN65751_c0_g1~~TRINITY_DN65751_c0_g1_i1.p1  ORF type:complete len:146 (+),score=42.13 TRINITY_DN65751_c0_g1_i1:82-519(+)